MATAVIAGLASMGGAVIAAGGFAAFAAAGGSLFTAFALGAGLSMVSRALAPSLDVGSQLSGLSTTVRDPASSRKIIYGRVRVGGSVVFVDTTGNDNEYVHLVIAMAGHEIDAFEEIYFNDEKVWDNGNFVGTWAPYIHFGLHDGSQTTVDSTLVTESTKWTSDHKLLDTAYIYARLKWDDEQYPNGLPNISAVVRGKKVYNPSTSTTEWSQNPALILRDYLLDSKYGLAESVSNINSAALASAQSVCDEDVTLDAGGTQKRFTCDGVIDTASSRQNNIEALLTSMAGKLVHSGGEYFISASEYVAPTVTIDESVMVGAIQIKTKQSRRALYNGVKGVFNSEDDRYQTADYPPVISSTYSLEDGDPIYLDMPLAFTTNHVRAQRIAKRVLLQSRQQAQIIVPCNLAALKFKAGDTIMVTNQKIGWTSKIFEVTGYNLDLSPDGGVVVNVDAIETSSTIYDWNASEESVYLGGGEVDIYDGKAVPPTFVVASSETYINGDGMPMPQIGVSWTASADAFVDHYIVGWKQSTDSNYKTATTTGTSFDIQGIKNTSAKTYNVYVRSVNNANSPSAIVNAADVAIPARSATDIRIFAGNENEGAAGFSVDGEGHVTARNITIYRDDGSVFFSSSEGFTDEALTQISSVTGTSVTTIADTLANDADVETIILVAETDLTIKAKLNSAFFGSSTVSGADALTDIPENFTVKILYKEQSAGSYTELASQTYTRTTGTPTATQYQADTSVFEFGSELNAYAYITRSLGSVDADGFSILTATLNDLAGAGSGTTYLFKTEVSTTDTSYNASDNHVDSSAQRIISITSAGTGFHVENGTGSQGVPEGDITAVTAGTNLTGGGTSGDVTLNLNSTISGNHTFSNNLTVSGDLTVNGTTTTLNTASLDVEDKNITINYGAGDTSASANGAGITIQDAVNSTTDATILWDATNDEFDFSHAVAIPSLSLSGALTTTSTIDGRDIAADGSKLDGIDSGAEVNVQADWNATSGDAFILNKPNIPADAMPISGGTFTGNVDFNDGVRARFGASDDLQIYHSGTQSYIQDTGTGSLSIETNGTHINLRGGAGNNDMAKFQSGGGVQLFHSGSEKLEVTSTGIDVTGTVVATGGNSTNWNTAYGWGDHATAGYYPASNPNGYTNDQTAAEILTAIKTVDGSGSGLDADTVDGLHASDIVESSNGISGNLDTEYDAQMFGWSSSTTGKPASSYGQGISIVSSGKTHNNSNNWITQLGFGTTDNTSYFRTKVNSGGWSSWRTIWNSSNDGSGSGLDADLLDGQHGSYYYSSDNLPLKIKAGGSGPSTENLNTIANSVSTGQLEYRGFNSSSSNAPPVSDNANGVITVGQHGGNYNAQLAFSSNGSMYFRDNPSSSFGSWRKVYDAGNDGSGSGLDADLLDGQHGSAYLRSNVSATNSVDLRAPVFYDSDNTANYLDSPTSSVFRLNGSTAVNLAVGGSNKLVATSTGVGIGTSSPSEKLHVQDSTGSPQIRIDNQGTASGIASLLFRSGGAGNPSSIIQSGGTSSGNQGIVFKHGDFGAEVERMRIDSAGAVTAYNSLRAPIFYDSNNTGYYTDPASISRMANVYANKVYLSANASYKIGFWGGTTNYTIGMSQAWDATNGGRVAGETTSDYNMYFTMSGGTNRGFVFRNSNSSGSAVAGIDAGGNARFNGSVGVNGSTVIDPSRNLININDFTSTGTVYLDNPNNSSTTDPNIDSKGALTSGTAYSYHALFKDGNGNIKGRITHNQYGAQFSNLSDYRAKEDYQEVENATSRLMSIPVRNFQWIGSDLRTDGFLAHEIAEVIPEAVVGEKDAVLEDGTPDYQSIDQSKIVPLLVKTIQEQQAVIESLEARLTALENA